MQEFYAWLENIFPWFAENVLVWQPSFMGLLVELGLFLIIFVIYKLFPKSGFFVFFEMFFEKVFEFFEDILWIDEKKWIKLYITSMFFIILFSNLLWVFLDFLNPIFVTNSGLLEKGSLGAYIEIPTADINFNVAMALIWVIIIILEQFKALGFWKTIYEYVPVFGKDYIPYERGKLPMLVDWPLFLVIKTFDIIISVFLWLLDIVWHIAKVISLSFRLFWNMTSGWMLLAMLFWAVWALTIGLTWIDFPVLAPIILYLQGLLVTFIQALVFPLLIAIFIKVAKVG